MSRGALLGSTSCQVHTARLFRILAHLNLKVTNRRREPRIRDPAQDGKVPGTQVEYTVVSDLVLHVYLTF